MGLGVIEVECRHGVPLLSPLGRIAARSGGATTRQFKTIIPESLRAVYAEAVTLAIEPRVQGKAPRELRKALNRLGYRTRTGKPWRHPQQIIKLLRSFGGEG
jgi:hypothetical protein